MVDLHLTYQLNISKSLEISKGKLCWTDRWMDKKHYTLLCGVYINKPTIFIIFKNLYIKNKTSKTQVVISCFSKLNLILHE